MALHVKKLSTNVEVKNGSKFEHGLHPTIYGDSLTINDDKILSIGKNGIVNEMNQILSLILVNQEKIKEWIEKRLEKDRQDRRRELDEIKGTLQDQVIPCKV